MRWTAWVRCVLASSLIVTLFSGALAEQVERRASDTLTAIELNEADSLLFTLASGQTRMLTIESTEARVLLTNLPRNKQGFHGGGTLYEMSCRLRIDGQPLTMRRYVPVQQSFYEPLVVNGLRVWFDGVRKMDRFLNDNHGGGVPRKDVRLAVQDLTLPLCPQELRPWYPQTPNYIDVAESYNADDVWMGPYQGADLHGGLDINMPIGTPLWAPLDFDDQYYFNSLKRGDNNNRWRGIRIWPNGQRWVLQAHHIVRLHVTENTPLKQGTHYAEAAGVLTGSHAHSHFVFKIGAEDDEVLLDAWILFWQIFENNKRRAGKIRAAMAPLGPARTGQSVAFDSQGSQAGVTGNGLRYRWTFGDGGTSVEARPIYVYARPGLYPVTLTVDDGAERAQFTQHLTVDGPEIVDRPALALHSPDAIAFRVRSPEVLDVYGWQVKSEPCVLEFVARPRTAPRPTPQFVTCMNLGGSELASPVMSVHYREGQAWLNVLNEGGRLAVAVDATRLQDRHGIYRADVTVDCPGAANSPQSFGVQLVVPPPRDKPSAQVTVDNGDPGCYATPWHWLSPQFYRHSPDKWRPGYRGDYLLAASPSNHEFVRFTPDLQAGAYRLSLVEETPFPPSPLAPADSRFQVRVRHKAGVEVLWVEPRKSRELGVFSFNEGREGYVEVLSSGARGPVVADAVRFERQLAADGSP